MKIVLLGDVIFEGDEETAKAKYDEISKEMNFTITKVVTNIPVIHNFHGRRILGKEGYNLIDLQMLFAYDVRSKIKEREIIHLEE